MRLNKTSKAAASLAFTVLIFISIYIFKVNFAVSHKINAALVTMVHQKDLNNIIEVVRNVEDRFNRKFNYDWIILSEENFNEPFKESVSSFIAGEVYFRTINRQRDWKVPSTINKNKLLTDMHELDMNGVPDGGSNTFRIISNFLSMAISDYLPEYDYFAHIGHDIRLYCDTDDIFARMHSQKTKLAFTISHKAVPHSTNELNVVVSDFINENKEIVNQNHWVDTFVEPGSSFCEFSLGFAAFDLSFLRSKEYKEWFKAVDLSGGIFYNRWSANAVHVLGAALFLNLDEVEFLENVGIFDGGMVNCPTDRSIRLKHKCTCPFDVRLKPAERNQIFTYKDQSCTPKLLKLKGLSNQMGWENFVEKQFH